LVRQGQQDPCVQGPFVRTSTKQQIKCMIRGAHGRQGVAIVPLRARLRPELTDDVNRLRFGRG